MLMKCERAKVNEVLKLQNQQLQSEISYENGKMIASKITF